MYIEYFCFKEAPFSIAPDPRFFFMSDRHREALSHLSYGLQGAGGFVMLTGEVGTGKTTVSRALVEQLPDNTVIAYVHNPTVSELELLATLCDELSIAYDKQSATLKDLFTLLQHHLLALFQQGKTCVVMIDEAQMLTTAVLEQLRLLTNLDFEHHKLIHIVLIGQPELQQKLKQTELRQLAQRVAARYHLLPLTESELANYTAYRLSIAAGNPGIFTPAVLKKIHHFSGGVPRLINLICDKALHFAFNEHSDKVLAKHVVKAADAVLVTHNEAENKPKHRYLISLILIGLLGILSSVGLYNVRTWFVADVQAQPAIGTETSLQMLTSEIETARKEGVAMQALYKVWGLAIKQQDATCINSRSAQLRCLRQQGIYSDLEQYNLPAVVQLRDDFADSYFATLISITPAGIELLIDDAHILVTQAWFERYWMGEYQLLWHAPKAFKRSLKLHDTGSLVTWVDNVVTNYFAQESRFTDVFDEQLRLNIIEFQQQNNLDDDGIVGQKTMMFLSLAANNNMPRLDQSTYLTGAEK